MNFFNKQKKEVVTPDLDQRYQEAVSNTDWQVLKRGDCFEPTTTKEAVVICVAVWSHPDIEALESFRAMANTAKRQVFIFSLHDLNFEEITHFMPGIYRFTQTPVVAEYKDGALVRTIEGKAARDWMERKS